MALYTTYWEVIKEELKATDIYNSLGKYLGKIETNGHSYDSRGGYIWEG